MDQFVNRFLIPYLWGALMVLSIGLLFDIIARRKIELKQALFFSLLYPLVVITLPVQLFFSMSHWIFPHNKWYLAFFKSTKAKVHWANEEGDIPCMDDGEDTVVQSDLFYQPDDVGFYYTVNLDKVNCPECKTYLSQTESTSDLA